MHTKWMRIAAILAIAAMVVHGVGGLLLAELVDRDKSGTTGCQETKMDSQALCLQVLTRPASFQAEGTGLEPATGYPAPHFQCGR